jgi:hypothetical protein
MVYDNGSNVYAGMGQDLAAGNSTDIFAHGAGGGFITFGNLGTNKTTYTEWVRISTTGNLLIGTTTDAGYKLNVNGTARFIDNVVTEGVNGISLTWSGNTFNDSRNGRIRAISSPDVNPYSGGLAFDVYRYEAPSYQYFEAVRFKANGNVGIGTSSPSTLLHVNGSGTIGRFQSSVSYVDLSFINSTSSNGFIQYNGNNFNFFANSGSTPTMTITGGAPGNVLIGTTSDNNSAKLQVNNGTGNALYIDTTVADGATRDAIYLFEDDGQASGRQAISWYNGNQSYYKARLWTQVGSSYAATVFGIDVADDSRTVATRLAIRNGNVLIGTTTDAGYTLNVAGNAQIIKSTTSTALVAGLSGVTGSIIRFSYNGSFVGSISTDGSNTAYNTSSDYRLKEELKPIDNPLQKVLSLNPVNFKYKNSKTRQDGFIAHEIQEILPYLVTGEKDGEQMQEVDYSKLTPILIAAIKEQQKQIEELKNKVS